MDIRLRTGAPRSAPPVYAPPPFTLRSRPAGYAAAEECLAVHASSPRRSRLERALGIRPLGREAAALYGRALAEESTARALSRLPADWTVLHSVPAGGGVVPHLAVGPAGVFAVLSQPRAGATVWVAGELLAVDGAGSAAMAEAAAAAGIAADRLAPFLGHGVGVRPIVAFPRPRRMLVRTPPEAVQVLAAEELVPWLRSLPEICSARTVDRIADAAELPATWSDAEPGDASRHRQRFERLQAELAAADRRWEVSLRVLVAAGLAVCVLSASALAALVGALLVG